MDTPDLTGLSPAMQLHILQAYIILKFAGSLYSALRNGGGIKRILTTVWTGENLPKPIAQDYKSELSKQSPSEQTSFTS